MSSAPTPGPHGGDGQRVARWLGVDPGDVLDLSASFNPFAPDVARLASAHLDSLRRYPDADSASCLLAQRIGVAPERLLLTNGGSEAIALLSSEVGGRVDEPEFSLHPRGGAPRWRSNPHNPTGLLAGPGERAAVWDEAFYPLAAGRWTRGDSDALATVGSLTKVFSCPGLRIGYVLAAPELIERLRRRQSEWSVSSLALAVLPELLAVADLASWTEQLAILRRQLTLVLERHGLGPQRSDANFVLCASAAGLRARLLPHGVVVRDCASFGLPGQVRVAVPGPDGLERLAKSLEASAT